MSDLGDAFTTYLSGGANKSKRSRPIGPVSGTVLDVTATTARVTLDGFSPDFFFGPMPFTRSDQPPQPGDQCLVIFTGSESNPAWLIGWQVKS
ncbi:hypothetical protein GTQ99_00180 [Kineococcus sp. T13]|uniref:hypothetical protein n=1 Tax=Kineococcus vitellinus TaxID=2696565 RepID=UPI0014136EE8|nr:hypothetical protein [Kineococcus vitellinus]NAZ73847.1 hypothetical protein [Kineococcus vitellinus]